jgi:hypothetical protein
MDPAQTDTLPVFQAGGFGASVEAFAWEVNPYPGSAAMRLWLVSLLGPQEAVKALWARLLKGEAGTMSFDKLGQARLCALASLGAGGWRFFGAGLCAAAGYHGVLVPEIALFRSDRPEFLLLARPGDEVAALHYRFLNRRLDLPLHASWAGWLWERALGCGEAIALDCRGFRAFRCAPDAAALADSLCAAVRRHELGLPIDECNR